MVLKHVIYPLSPVGEVAKKKFSLKVSVLGTPWHTSPRRGVGVIGAFFESDWVIF